mmetsp:Transcript_27513/g.72338  ORF Transcript_27513/g.72338 Transcript_27513/m.72338 type:complete len:361 (-) Transcript_27513:36-1118(-)|eukprot:CAMPEP_0182944392 /NCGR_PEP_ID=MMETSP0105_2-20130417/53866_1 /TAXON_ID=81532 ORGANISM="Acanthoeca-like sp., Strain 10tr" /NCGR_SAMPLE_ID=MMETSP0105_2 /ASSEMBLY_ACC=CAM_ASM_000205 /LENGTH=360 /DNA_ID=CAMNT_0025084317 /DNA_START=212 /DNA_END=1294 /DNA_ORIENTATION=+
MPGKPVVFESSDHFRQRLLLATLSTRPVKFEKIRADSDEPGLKDYEVSFLRLLDKICNGSRIDINYSGSTVTYRPGLIVGGKVSHTCPPTKAIGYFLEPITILAPFAKKPLMLTLEGVTNNDTDPSVDALRTVALPILRRFGVDAGLELKISKRGAPPLGGGEVFFRCPVVRALTPIKLVDSGRIKRIRGIAYSTRVSPQISNRVVDAARGVLNKLLPDVYIYTDNYRGAEAGKSPGFGLSLVAESTTSALASAECIARPAELAEDLGVRAAKSLLAEIKRGGCIDTQHQSMCLLLMTLCPEDLSRVRMGSGLTQYTIQYLRDIRTFMGTTFRIKPDEPTGTTIFSCIGSGYINVSKKAA